MSESFLPVLPCLCGSFRRTARSLTQLYEEALRPLELRPTQLTILQVLSRMGKLTQGQLGEALAMDSTSLTRTLAIMIREGWVTSSRGKDRRERWLSLSRTGNAQLRRALPVWEKVQSQLRLQVGEKTWDDLLKLTRQVTALTTTKGDSL
jgi:DNA-binding MarR family transcriptional regulator